MIKVAFPQDIEELIALIHYRYGNVDNKSSETIRSELTSEDIESALGYVPADSAEGIESAFRQDGDIEEVEE